MSRTAGVSGHRRFNKHEINQAPKRCLWFGRNCSNFFQVLSHQRLLELRQVLIEVAHVASKTKDTYLAAQYRPLAARRGKQRALVARTRSR